MTSTLKVLGEIISEIMECDVAPKPEDLLVDDLGMASIDFVELNVAIEKKFGISLAGNFFDQSVTMAGLVRAIDDAPRKAA